MQVSCSLNQGLCYICQATVGILLTDIKNIDDSEASHNCLE